MPLSPKAKAALVGGTTLAGVLILGRARAGTNGGTGEPVTKPTNGGGGVPIERSPIGPRPPSTWQGLATATVRGSPGVFARTGAGTNNPIGPGGGADGTVDRDPDRNMAPWQGRKVAVLQTGLQGPGAKEWWKIITPGGYELFAAAVANNDARLLEHDATGPALPGPAFAPLYAGVSGFPANPYDAVRGLEATFGAYPYPSFGGAPYDAFGNCPYDDFLGYPPGYAAVGAPPPGLGWYGGPPLAGRFPAKPVR